MTGDFPGPRLRRTNLKQLTERVLGFLQRFLFAKTAGSAMGFGFS